MEPDNPMKLFCSRKLLRNLIWNWLLVDQPFLHQNEYKDMYCVYYHNSICVQHDMMKTLNIHSLVYEHSYIIMASGTMITTKKCTYPILTIFNPEWFKYFLSFYLLNVLLYFCYLSILLFVCCTFNFQPLPLFVLLLSILLMTSLVCNSALCWTLASKKKSS